MQLSFSRAILLSSMSVVVSMLLLAFFFQYRFMSNLLDEELQDDVELISNETQEQFENLKALVNISFLGMRVLRDTTMDDDDIKAFAQEYRALIQQYQNIRQIGFAADDNRYIYLAHNGDSFELYVYSDHGNRRILARYTLNDDGTLTLLHQRQSQFKITSRGWFVRAKANQELIMSLPYQSHRSKQEFLTFAQATAGGVLFLDIQTAHFSKMLNNLTKNGHIELFFEANNQIWMRSSQLGLTNKELLQFRQGNNASYEMREIPLTDTPLTLYMLFDKKAAQLAYMGYFYQFLLAASAILLMALLFSWVLSKQVQKPLRKIMQQNSLIAKREFDAVTAIDSSITEIVELSHSLEQMAHAIAKHQREQEALLQAFIQVIADAIDAKSPYTAGHCQRVPALALMIAQQMHDDVSNTFRFEDEDERRTFEMAAWLHDCGKVTTPEFVVDKATKLETIYNRIHEIRTRFEVFYRDAEIAYLQGCLRGEDVQELREHKAKTVARLHSEFETIAQCNMGAEFMDEEKINALKAMAKERFKAHFSNTIGLSDEELSRMSDDEKQKPWVYLLEDLQMHKITRSEHEKRREHYAMERPSLLYNRGELYNLCVEKGTLSAEERYKINEHVIMTLTMLNALPLPKMYANLPELAASHHETLNATGYPRALDATQLTTSMRIIAIADIFEALSASDRPYKRAKPLSQIMNILLYMAKDKHIDAAIFYYMVKHDIVLNFAQQFMPQVMIDTFDKAALLQALQELGDSTP